MVKHVDSGGQVHLVTNIRKPRKWRRYEYLLSSGTLWIDTKYNVGPANASNIKLYIDFKATSTGVGNRWWVHGIGGGSTCVYAGIGNGSTGTNIPFTYGNGQTDVTTSVKGNLGTRYKYTLDLKNKTYNIVDTSGSTVLNLSGIGLLAALYTRPMTIFAWNMASGTTIGYSHSNDVYEYKLWDNDVLVRHMVPAEYNGQYGMWDLVEDKFYRNAGTGAFTVGPEMKNYDEIYEVRKTSSLLPAGVELYDYILSSGGAYLITNYAPNLNMKVKTKIMAGATTNEIAISGYSWTASSAFLMLYQNTVRWHMNSGDGLTSTVDARNNAVLEIEASSNRLVVNNVVTTGTAISTYNESNYYLFYTPTTYGVTKPYFDGKMYYFQIHDNGILVRNFLPCTYLGEPGMWDTVENKFYRNQGTGLFTLGSKITLKEYESLTSDGNAYINTLYIPNNNTKIDLKFNHNRVNEDLLVYITAYRFGNYNTTNGFLFLRYKESGLDYDSLKVGLGWPSGAHTTISLPAGINQSTVDFKNKICTLNGSLYTTLVDFSLVNMNLATMHLPIFAICDNTLVTTPKMSKPNHTKDTATLYYYKIFNNDVLVRDFIPVSYNGTPGLWDKVEWKFYGNAGSGSFTLGPEKASGVYPVWTPIEYLESTGILWIDTEIENTIPTKYNLIGAKIGERTSIRSGFFGSNNWLYSLIFYVNNTNLRWCNTNNCYDYTISSGIFYNIECIKEGTMYVNNNSTPISSDSNTGSGNIKLFVGASYAASSVRIAGFKMYNGEILLRDMIPVRIGNIGYMFDRVTGKMFGNAGTGSFILGPDL